ncbi:MAG: metalloregulator ArsR/SmtB family transcription factor [Deltaproteobacteria bacterium]|nr:metalloregulator ArsR/SmtB family transcription factor [Deltaproteobacteria bacterium]
MTDISTTRVLEWMAELGDLTRVRMLAACDQHELSVAELCAVLQIPQSTASRHLKVLSESQWLTARRDGTSRFYQVDKEGLAAPARRLWKLIQQQSAEDGTLRGDEARLERVLLERQSRSEAFFASSAGQWDKLRGELFGDHFDLSGFLALLDPGAAVGDLGCGTGKTAEMMAPFANKVVAVDSSAAMIKAARQRLRQHNNVELHRAHIEDLPLEDAMLDVAFVNLVLHHISDPPRALREVARVLKPQGRLVVLDMQQHERNEYRQQMGHVWLGFTREQIEAWCKGAALDLVHFVKFPPNPDAKGPALFAATGQKQFS